MKKIDTKHSTSNFKAYKNISLNDDLWLPVK